VARSHGRWVRNVDNSRGDKARAAPSKKQHIGTRRPIGQPEEGSCPSGREKMLIKHTIMKRVEDLPKPEKDETTSCGE